MSDIEFYYDFGSPNAYLVHKVLPRLVEKHGAQIVYKPVLLGGIFKATGNQAPFGAFAGVKGKVDYIRAEFQRFVERHSVPFKWNNQFPVNTLMLMRTAIFAQGQPWEATFNEAAFDAMWMQDADMSDPSVFEAVLEQSSLPVGDIKAALASEDIKAKLMDATQSAVARGIFGAPTMFLKEEMFFGKDALNDLDWRLSQMG